MGVLTGMWALLCPTRSTVPYGGDLQAGDLLHPCPAAHPWLLWVCAASCWAGQLCLLAGKLSLCSISSAQPTALLVEMLQGCRGHPSLLAAPLNWQGLGLALFCSLPCPRASPTAAGLWLQVRTELGEQHRASPSAVVCSVPGVQSGQTRPRRAQSGLSQASCIQATLMG